jgi:hypothetical protein
MRCMARREHTVRARLRLGAAAAVDADGNGHANAAAKPWAQSATVAPCRGLRAGQWAWFDLDGVDR